MEKKAKQKIVFIGSGNVATSLSQALKGKYEIAEIYSKTLSHARKLARQTGSAYTDDLKQVSTEADIYIIAIKDDAISELCKKLKLPGKLVLHTSGSTEMNVLEKVSDRHGVLWPMYSFAGIANFPADNLDSRRLKQISENLHNLREMPVGTPIFIEGSDKRVAATLNELVRVLKGTPYYLNSEERAKVHMTAVFVNNFPNHLFTIAETLCKEAGVPFNLFLPLAKETVENITKQSPRLTQTGPASRNDKKIIRKQTALLKSHSDYQKIYKLVTKSIIKTSRAGR